MKKEISSKKPSFFVGLLVVVGTLFVVWHNSIGFFGFDNVDINTYEGDGTIRKIGNNFLSYGYEIVFAEFPLSQAYKNSFDLKRLPTIDKHGTIGLRIKFKNRDEPINIRNARLKLELIHKNGDVYFSADQNLSDYVRESGPWYYFYYDFERNINKKKHSSSLDMNPLIQKDSFRLNVQYTPPAITQDIKGEIILECGGSY